MLIGRDREADQLRARLGRHRGILVVTGPAGIGKSTLLRELVEPDATWLHGLATARTRPGDALLPVLPAVSGTPERDASSLLRHLRRHRLVVDDAQWLDPYSLTVVELVATATRPVGPWRTADPSSPAPPPRHWEKLALGPLGTAAAEALARQSRSTLSPEELGAVLEIADGSPLLIRELASGPSVAPNAASALLGRVRGLSAAGRAAVLLVAAADGGLAESLVPPSDREELVRSGLAVLVHGRWWIRHVLLQESILELEDPSTVSRAHATLADLLAEADPAAAARHAEVAGHHDEAVALAERVVVAAEDPLARARASLALADLLEVDRPADAWRMRVEATSELRALGAYHEVVAALGDRELPTADAELYGMARVNLGGAHWALGDQQRAFDNTERGLNAVEGSRGEAELLLRAGLAMYLGRIRFDGASALVHAREAVAIAEERGQHEIFARTRVAAALLAMGDPGWKHEIDSAVCDAITAGDAVGERLAREARHIHAFVTGGLDTALSDLRILTDQTDATDLATDHRAFRLLLELLALGDRAAVTAEAERLLSGAAFFGQRAVAVAAGAVAALEQGRADIARRLLDRTHPSDAEALAVIRWARTELAWATGQRLAEEGTGELAAPILLVHPATTMRMVTDAWCAFEAGAEVPEAPIATLPGFAGALPEVEGIRLLAAGEHTTAAGRFDDAAGAWSEGSDRRGVLRCGWGAALAGGGTAGVEAVQRLEQVWSDATHQQSAPIATRAARLLRQHGVPKPPFPAPAAPPLSGPQTQTLRLLASGFTTQHVAALLGLQNGTIEDHLHQAQDRLGLDTRADALRWVAQRP